MTIGDGIFLASLMIATVLLYGFTKDRWKWKRITKYAILVPLGLLIVVGLLTWGYSIYRDRLTTPDELLGIKLGISRQDVLFLKGTPSSDPAGTFVYDEVASKKNGTFVVRFANDRVRYVMFAESGESSFQSLQGLYIGTDFNTVQTKLGKPSNVSTSKDGLSRILCYEKYGTCYQLLEGKVVAFAIYDVAQGPIVFNAEAGAVTR